MNANDYIKSGAIEACLAGVATLADWEELEQMCAQYPEVILAKTRLEIEQERMHIAAAKSTPPPAYLKAAIFSQLDFSPAGSAEAPAFSSTVPVVRLPSEKLVPVVPISAAPKSIMWLRGAIAASIIMLMGSVALNFYFYSQSAQNLANYKTLVAQQASLVAKNEAMQASFDMLRSPSMKIVPMLPPSPKTEGAMATVYWDYATKDVYVIVNQLPNTKPEKQYQLWAIVDGKPVDAGMVPTGNDANLLVRMKNIPNATAFAITLENKGGSPTPTIDAMMVFGGV